MLRRILDDPKASHRALTEAIRTDAELNASLLKIGVEGTIVKHYGLSSGSRSEQAHMLRLD